MKTDHTLPYFHQKQRRKQAKLACFVNEYSIFLFMTLPTQLTYAFPGNDAKNACWYFVMSTSETWLFSLVSVKA
jgi:hypothetical protein